MGRPDFEDLEVYKLAENLANEIWHMVKLWDEFPKNTMESKLFGRQIAFVPTLQRGKDVTIFKIIDVLSRLLEGLYTKQLVG